MANPPLRIYQNARVTDQVLKALLDKTGDKYTALAREMAVEIPIEIDRIVRSEFVNDRDGVRRKRGTRHLLGSFEATVDVGGRNSFPLRVVVRSKAPVKKVAALELGSPPHTIYPADGEYLYFPYNPGGSTRGSAYRARGVPGNPKSGARGGTGNRVFLAKLDRPVEHRGNKAYGFMRRGTQRVVDRRLH